MRISEYHRSRREQGIWMNKGLRSSWRAHRVEKIKERLALQMLEHKIRSNQGRVTSARAAQEPAMYDVKGNLIVRKSRKPRKGKSNGGSA